MRKTKTQRVCALILAVLILAALFSACGRNGIVGAWKNDERGLGIELSANGTVTLTNSDNSQMSGTYTANDGVLVICMDGVSETYSYVIDKNSMSLIYDGEAPLLTRG